MSTPDGAEVAGGVADRAGRVVVQVPPGNYVVEGAPVPQAATPRPTDVTATAGPVTVTVRYESNLQ